MEHFFLVNYKLPQWRDIELQTGSRIKAAKIQKVIDRIIERRRKYEKSVRGLIEICRGSI